MNWKKCTVCRSMVIYGVTCVCGAFAHSKDVLEKVCFPTADCVLHPDLPAKKIGGLPLNVRQQTVATSTSTAGPNEGGRNDRACSGDGARRGQPS